MSLERLDFIFPFIAFGYGVIYIFVSESKIFLAKGKEQMGEYYATFTSHKWLAWMCLFVGGIWSLQNLYFT